MDKLDIINAQNNIQSYINMIKNIQLSDQIKLIKWKNQENQVVIQTNKFFYKIYQYDSIKLFDSYIRFELGKIYKEKFNIIWNIYSIQKDSKIYQIQQRQKLQVLTDQLSQQEILQSWNSTLMQLQKNLQFQLILKQLQLDDDFSDIIKLKLVRDNIVKKFDYAIKDNNVILLDDTDWFIAMIDKNNSWICKHLNIVDINTKYGVFYFVPINYGDIVDNFKTHINGRYNKWHLLNIFNNKQKKKILLDFKEKRQLYLQNKILTLFNYQNKLLSNKENNNKLIN